MSFVELHSRTYASFLAAASSPEEMIETASGLGYRALAITDLNEVGGVVRAHEAAKRTGLSLCIGAELNLLDPGVPNILLIAKNRGGYRQLTRLLTHARRSQPRGAPGVYLKDIITSSDGLLCLLTTACAPPVIRRLQSAFADDLSLLVTRNFAPDDAARLRDAKSLSQLTGIALCASGAPRYHTPLRKPLMDVLTAIAHNTPLNHCGYLLQANGEQHLQSPREMHRRFTQVGLTKAIDRAHMLAERCAFSLDELRFVYPEKHLPPGETPITYFRQIVAQGANERYGAHPSDQIKYQLAHELELIETLKVEGFFLTMYDIIRFARSQGILCQGRGSAANSAVCYALGITSVEPVQAGLLFERFISLERGEPPDIDVDFEHERREEVIQWVYDFYGRDHAGLVCTNICYRPRSAVRDVGKAIGLTIDQTDRLAKGLSQWTMEAPLESNLLLEAGVDTDSTAAAQLREFVPQILGFPRHRGTHVGGMIVTAEPLIDIAPLENAAMADRAIIPWDKNDVDALGMCKFDLLGLGILTALRKSMSLIEIHEGRRYTLASIPQSDELTYERISASDTIGTFQIESRAQQSMLPRLQPKCFYDLVIAISIIRPGPIQGGMVHPFLRRRNGEEPISFPHPSLVPILARTLGVPLFQEQVMRMAVEVAGFSPGEADELRRKMGAWRQRGNMGDVKERLISGMTSRGISTQYAEQIFKQIQGFGEYGFPESHAISFALLAYASAWIKTHYPAHYVTGMLNSQPLGFYSPHTLIEDSKRHGVVFLPIDVEYSQWDCTMENHAVRLGLRYVNGLGAAAKSSYDTACLSRPFRTVDNFAEKTGFDRRALAKLAHAGAFRSLNRQVDSRSPEIVRLCRRAAFWNVLRPRGPAGEHQIPLPDDPRAAFPSMTRQEEVSADFEVTGVSADAHPVSFLRESLAARGAIAICDLTRLRDGISTRVAGLIIGRQHPSTAKGFVFLSLEDETELLNVIVNPQLFERQKTEITRYPLVLIEGQLQSATGSISLKATKVVPLTRLKEQPNIQSRDFQ